MKIRLSAKIVSALLFGGMLLPVSGADEPLCKVGFEDKTESGQLRWSYVGKMRDALSLGGDTARLAVV